MLIAPADDLEEEVGGVGIVGEVANLIDGEQRGARVVAKAALEGAGGLPAIEIEQQVRGGDKARGVAGQDDLMDDVLGEHRLAEALGTDQEDVLGAVEEVEAEDPFERGPVERGRPVPVPISDRFEAAEPGGGEPTFDTAAPALLELGGDEVLAPFAVGDVTYPLARKGAYATEQVAGAISGRNLLHRNVLTSQHQQRTAQAPKVGGIWRTDDVGSQLHLEQRFQTVTGWLAAGGQTVPIEEGGLSGSIFTFRAAGTDYRAEVDDSTMRGVARRDNDTRTWQSQRVQ